VLERRIEELRGDSCRRWSGATTKHTMAPTSPLRSPGTFRSSVFGAAWHQPTTRPSRYATRPFAFAARMSSLREARFCSFVRSS
jgi:hypothetical protein